MVYSYFWGLLLFKDHITIIGVLGSLLIAGGVLLGTAGQAAVQPASKSTATRDAAGAGCGSLAVQQAPTAGSSIQYTELASRDDSYITVSAGYPSHDDQQAQQCMSTAAGEVGKSLSAQSAAQTALVGSANSACFVLEDESSADTVASIPKS